jgi:hypothetical protein
MSLFLTKKKKAVVLASVAIILITVSMAASTTNTIPAQLATTAGVEPKFQVIVTLLGVDSTTGDVITFVNVGNVTKVTAQNASVKLFQTNSTDAGVLEVTFKFSNVTIPIGSQFKACNMVVKDLDLVCKTGVNSPAKRPEFVDLSLHSKGGGEKGDDEGGILAKTTTAGADNED